jgi:hypothetical protein
MDGIIFGCHPTILNFQNIRHGFFFLFGVIDLCKKKTLAATLSKRAF